MLKCCIADTAARSGPVWIFLFFLPPKKMFSATHTGTKRAREHTHEVLATQSTLPPLPVCYPLLYHGSVGAGSL